MAGECGAAGLWQRGGYECSSSGTSSTCRMTGGWQTANSCKLPRRQRREACSLIVCMAKGAHASQPQWLSLVSKAMQVSRSISIYKGQHQAKCARGLQ